MAALTHRQARNVSFSGEGEPHWETLCGKRLGETELQMTGDPKLITCPSCKAGVTLKRGSKR